MNFIQFEFLSLIGWMSDLRSEIFIAFSVMCLCSVVQ